MYDASYNGPVENSRVSSGFIAQEVQGISDVSYCVRDTNIRNDDGEIIEERPLAINYTELLPYHTSAIQELVATITSLEQRIAALENPST